MTIRHRGLVNTLAAFEWVRSAGEVPAAPGAVAVYGCSAGAL
eukprot:gene13544-12053_t